MNHDIIKPYDAEGEKKAQVTSMFDRIAPYYDFLNRLLTLRIDVLWRKKAIAMVSSPDVKDVLDVATGTGDLAIAVAKALPQSKVIGMDIAVKMLAIGDQKLEKLALTDRVTLEAGDSEAMRYEDGRFDLAMSSFGVCNFGNLKKGLSEMHRVLRPGGRIMVLEFSRPRVFPIKNMFNIYFKYVLPVIGKLTSKDPRAYKYLYESVQQFPDFENFTKILEEVGFKHSSYKPLTFGICTVYLATK
ncbi:MAG TPA: bifunctional demethylmenaquinone methyltransferase/2-methoxy-6-polyprenyl-1,4-benzoquinol methylase UbiE [Saprospiraceae bacterium]|nr:bifunctional demethylmenaquinone methyltransferase/2-methoxy-6-polyprenyl-1,4-benzoquinol methylase UbiE [Saprospiraceae bacterium]